MREPSSEPPAQWTLYGVPLHKGIALGIGAPLYLPTYGSPAWLDPRLFAQDEDEWHAIEYRMPTEPVEVIGLARSLDDIPPVLAPYVRVVGWIVEQLPEPPLPQAPILLVPKLPSLLPAEAPVILDANAGVAYIEPTVAVLARYQAQLLRVATHTRYHLEGAHLPVRTWDSRPIQLGGVAAYWDELPNTAQAGIELVWLTSAELPESVSATAHALGGKPLWLHLPRMPDDDAYWQRLLRASVELNLTLFVDTADALQEASDSLAVAREALRAMHLPLGALEVGLLAQESLPELLEPLPYAVGWQVEQWTQPLAERLWEAQATARALGVRRAVIVPDAAPETLALALGLEPHTLIVPADAVPAAKARLALLGVAECREWLLLRLRDWKNPDLRARPEAWLATRAS
ncbi:MAG: hypothetical protein WHS44_11810 [Fimbriimonadales bacterium]|nr:MAG: hypothetical protein KatS3mg018_2381 [Fimbriimonadales bacterium]